MKLLTFFILSALAAPRLASASDVADAVALASTIPMFNVNLNNYKYHGNPILTGGAKGEWDEGGISRVTVLRVGRKDWRLWYDGRDASGQVAIGLATSEDGIHWAKYSGNPVLASHEPWEGRYLSATSVVEVEGKFHLFYWAPGHLQPPQMKYIGLAVSPDGIHWTRAGNLDGRNGAVLGPEPEILNEGPANGGTGVDAGKVFLMREEERWLMNFTAFGRNGFWNGLAESRDGGMHWSKLKAPVVPVGGMMHRNTGKWNDNGVTLRAQVCIGNTWTALAYIAGISGSTPAVALAPDRWFLLGHQILSPNQEYEPTSMVPYAIEETDEWFHIFYTFGGPGGSKVGLVRAPRLSVRQPMVLWEKQAIELAGARSMILEPDHLPFTLHLSSDQDGELRLIAWNPATQSWLDLDPTPVRAGKLCSIMPLPTHAKLRLEFTPREARAIVSAWVVSQ